MGYYFLADQTYGFKKIPQIYIEGGIWVKSKNQSVRDLKVDPFDLGQKGTS